MLLLTSNQQEEIFHYIKKIFSDFKYFETFSSSVKALICDSTKVEFEPLFIHYLVEKYVKNSDQYETKEQKKILDSAKTMLTTTAVYLYSLQSFTQHYFYRSIDDLILSYPQFRDLWALSCSTSSSSSSSKRIDEQLSREAVLQELGYLLKFRNYMIVALMLIPAKGNKTFLLRIIERLEGSGNEYILGSGQKTAVTRRCDIYHQESKIEVQTKIGKKQREKLEEKSSGNVEESKTSNLLMDAYLKQLDKENTNGQNLTLSKGIPLQRTDSSSSKGSNSSSKSLNDNSNCCRKHHNNSRSQSPPDKPKKKQLANRFTPVCYAAVECKTEDNDAVHWFPRNRNSFTDLSTANPFQISEETEQRLLNEQCYDSFTEMVNKLFDSC
jgi:hypothetical protein